MQEKRKNLTVGDLRNFISEVSNKYNNREILLTNGKGLDLQANSIGMATKDESRFLDENNGDEFMFIASFKH